MKTSNIIIISTIVVFIIGFAINAAGIKKMYDQTDWNNPYRNFTKHNLNKTVDRVYILAPDSVNIWTGDTIFSVIQGKNNILMLQGEPNIHWQTTDSGLVVRLQDNAKGVLVIPKVKQIIISRVSCKLSGFNLDSLKLNVIKEPGKIVIRNSTINFLNASASNHGQISIEKDNRINKLNLALQGGTFSSGINIREIFQTVTPDSRIELFGNALEGIAQKK
ncbi:hypothetical protein [Paludibacter jiangxiensis]|uniref:Uncharacterized protein n=1 Tax=Paludibacter jiangxiensis TaxID=681398 RepID=A0A161LDV9_9BACT|nr:hypothetical protein [Paludibacter jiangxiensis]GAT62267.1 hypothetical protein PJIAN_1860 [Paludibacter jiangxiensis]